MRPYAKLYLTRKGERAARSGHPWVYGEEVTHVDGQYKTGDLVDVLSEKGKTWGTDLPMIFLKSASASYRIMLTTVSMKPSGSAVSSMRWRTAGR